MEEVGAMLCFCILRKSSRKSPRLSALRQFILSKECFKSPEAEGGCMAQYKLNFHAAGNCNFNCESCSARYGDGGAFQLRPPSKNFSPPSVS